ncbi:helix-turn-helix transcriptional regulator [Natrialba sp. SSL1]|uniref:helix-turn-helix transcriptional regulator n=1 Tax=Natrialba sp. SSL1 TaxID=1869245 RepID=UPI0008F91C6E|nr:helix-turn-helix domain-containing protein [Natrialba sp. SSL1]OIB56936.1 transcriptional regulator [Natrialba sp. SSL1]
MAPLPSIQISAGPHASVRSPESVTGSVPAAAVDAYTVEATIPFSGLGETAGGSSYWLSTIRDASTWEVSLIAILFLMIALLVGIRVVQAFSVDDFGALVRQTGTGTRTGGADSGTGSGSGTGSAPTPGSTDPQHPAGANAARASASAKTNANAPTETRPTAGAAGATGTESESGQARSYENLVSADTPPELLSDEGRVVRLLVKHGGQIRQHQIADETDWSKSKVSRILSSMYDDGTIEKTSVGRENVISLPDRPIGEDASTATDNSSPVP